jgi:phosphoserine phosphatase
LSPSEIRGAVFDLDEVLLNKRAAWAYTVEQALLSVAGRRTEPMALADEYRHRPWRDALLVLEPDREHVAAAAALCGKLWLRSALKRITVHAGIGMALAGLLAGGISMAAVTSVALPLARRQAQAAGVDRFLFALERNEDAAGADGNLYAAMAGLLHLRPGDVAFVSGDGAALRSASSQGLRPFKAAWAPGGGGSFPLFEEPGDLRRLRAEAGSRAGR